MQRSILAEAAEELHPAYFALVMATGIVSVACHLQGFAVIAHGLFYLNVAMYAILWILITWRIFGYWNRFFADFTDHKLAPGFFTIVAATGVLGSQFIIISRLADVAVALWLLTLILWLITTYAVFTSMIVKSEKPSIAQGLHGGWLISIVAAQSVSVLGSLISPHIDVYRELVIFTSLIVWLFGGMLYIWVISMIFYRYMFYTFSPDDLTPPYWINMGAVAISTLAGANLIHIAGEAEVLERIQPFIEGLTFFFWSTATWWIPMLVILGVWRHIYKKFPLSYSPLYWGAVFPLGMYTVATRRLAEETGQDDILIPIAAVFVFIALGAWLLTFAGMVARIGAKLAAARKLQTAA